jgi:hypothetical protein
LAFEHNRGLGAVAARVVPCHHPPSPPFPPDLCVLPCVAVPARVKRAKAVCRRGRFIADRQSVEYVHARARTHRHGAKDGVVHKDVRGNLLPTHPRRGLPRLVANTYVHEGIVKGNELVVEPPANNDANGVLVNMR